MKLSEDILEKYKKVINDPWEFLHIVNTKDEVDKKNPIKKFPVHLEYIKLFVRVWQRERLLLIPKSRRMKMSWTNISLFTWDAMFHRGGHFAFISKKEEDSDALCKRSEFICKNLELPKELIPKFECTYNKIRFPEMDSLIQGFPSGADQLRQYTFTGQLADEMAFWDNAEDMYSASYPTLEGGGRFVGLSSPAPGFFKRLVEDKLEDEDAIAKAIG